MSPDPLALLPTNKMDTERATAIVALGYPAVAPVLAELLTWLQDVNWPVASVLAPFLASIGTPLATYALEVLRTDDDLWKLNVLQSVVAKSPELRREMLSEIRRIAMSPTPGERAEGVDTLAGELLA
ncbi:MAG: DUF5071 domain-containing protein [Terricaulis sp.]